MTPKELYEWAKERKLEEAPPASKSLGEGAESKYPEIRDLESYRYAVIIEI